MKHKKMHWCSVCKHEMRWHRGPEGSQAYTCKHLKRFPIHMFKFIRPKKHEGTLKKT